MKMKEFLRAENKGNKKGKAPRGGRIPRGQRRERLLLDGRFVQRAAALGGAEERPLMCF